MLYDPEKRWLIGRDSPLPCTGHDDLYHPMYAHEPYRAAPEEIQKLQDRAKRICRDCPVLKECRRDHWGEPLGVVGGLDAHQRHQVRLALPEAVKRWPKPRRVAWGEAVYRLRPDDREGARSWREIQYRTGLPQEAAWEVRQEFLDSRPEKPPTPAAADIQPLARRSFPPATSPADAWVRTEGVVMSAHYKAQTKKGDWYLMTVKISGGLSQSTIWLRSRDVRIDRPQPVVIKERSNSVKSRGKWRTAA